ncbi:hypothetical protein S10a_00055 [Klebsiella phage VLCpiS10a]|jgi:hypothetical protein|nr:hypothetical protein S10a_00055 [Klebsiella phage VLCpiS10a]
MNHVNAIRCNDEYQCSHCGKSWDIHEEAPDCKMTEIDLPEFKTVDYFGLNLIIPSSIKFIGTNASGEVYGYSHEPERYDEFWDTYRCPSVIPLATVNLHGLDWRETLRKC